MTADKKGIARDAAECDWSSMRGMPAKLTTLLQKESDRGAILIVAAYLDEILGLIVQSACVSSKFAKDMLKWDQPAGGFSSRITLCEAFGLIHQMEARALNLIRRIRNQAAHFDTKGRGFDVLFDSTSTVNQVEALAAIFGDKGEHNKRIEVRQTFEMVSRLLATRLYFRGLDTRRPPKPLSLRESANQIRQGAKGTAWGKHAEAIEASLREGNFDPAMKFLGHVAKSLETHAAQGQPKTTASKEVAREATKSSRTGRNPKAKKAKPIRKKRKTSTRKGVSGKATKSIRTDRKPKAKKSKRTQKTTDL